MAIKNFEQIAKSPDLETITNSTHIPNINPHTPEPSVGVRETIREEGSWKHTAAFVFATGIAYLATTAFGQMIGLGPKAHAGETPKDPAQISTQAGSSTDPFEGQVLLAMGPKPAAAATLPDSYHVPKYNAFEKQLEAEVASYEGQNPKEVFRQARRLKRQGKFKEALPMYLHVANETKEFVAYDSAAECAEYLNQPDLAIQLADLSIKVNQEGYMAFRIKSRAYLDKGNIPKAQQNMQASYQNSTNLGIKETTESIAEYQAVMNK